MTTTPPRPGRPALQHRAFQVRLADPQLPDLDAAGTDAPAARAFTGLAVPWDTPTDLGWGREQIARGAFGTVEVPIPLYAQHAHLDGGLPVGVVDTATDSDEGLIIGGRLSATPAGDEVYTLMRDGALNRLSIGYEPIDTARPDDDPELMIRTRARLWEVSVVGIPAFADAAVTEVRAATTSGPDPAAGAPSTGRNPAMPDTTATDVEARQRLDEVERRVATLGTDTAGGADPAAAYRSAGEALHGLARGEEAARQLFTRAYTGATTADVGIPQTWVERMLRLVDRGRPMIGFFDREPLPPEGLTLAYPKVSATTDNTGKQAAQGDDLGYFELVTTTGTVGVDTYGNYAQLTRQIIERAPASYLDAVYRAQVIAYAKATEAATRTVLTGAAGTNTVAMGATLAASTVPIWLDKTIDAAAAIDDNSLGLIAGALMVASDVYKKLASFVDTTGRPMFAFTGGGEAVNAAGQGFGIVTPSGRIGDLPLIVNNSLTAGTAIVVAGGAIVTYESPGAPVRLDDDNIINLSKAFSVYGYLAPALVDAKGITKLTFS